MSKMVKNLFVIASLLVVLGGVIFVTVMSFLGWDFNKLNTVKFEENSYEISQDFSDISIDIDTEDIEFKASSDDKTRVVAYTSEKEKLSLEVVDGSLEIAVNNEKAWYDYINISWGSPKAILYLPQKEYGSLTINGSTCDIEIPKDLQFESIDISVSTGDVCCRASVLDFIKIKASTGDVLLEDCTAKSVDLTTSTGKINAEKVIVDGDINISVTTGDTLLNEVKCANLITTGGTGNVEFIEVIASENFDIKRSTGDVNFTKSDANEIFIKTSTGKITGSILTEKVFVIQTNTGDIDVPESTSGGKFKVDNDTGDIKITIG